MCTCVCVNVCLRVCMGVPTCMHTDMYACQVAVVAENGVFYVVMKQSEGTFTSVCIIPWTFVVKNVLLVGNTSYSITLSFQKYSGSWHAYAFDVMLQCFPWAVMCKNGQWKGCLWRLWVKSGIIMYLYCNYNRLFTSRLIK